MTANKKAMEIYSKCNKVIHDNELTCRFIQTYKNDRRWIAGKQCALIAVDEIMKECYDDRDKFWQEVKTEIKKL